MSLKELKHQGENKKILSTSAGFGLLRKGLIENMGTKRAKGFLLRYGWNLGVSIAEEAMKVSTDIDYLINQASILHLNTGHIGDIQSERKIEKQGSKKIKSIHGKGKWIDSFEAQEHLKNHGKSDAPVCYTLCGYASGYMSTILKKRVFVKETSCIGMGDKECHFEMKYEEDWGSEIHEEVELYQEHHIIEELNDTYEQLLEQRNYIEKVAKFHTRLTENISNGSSLQDITHTIFSLLNTPVAILDLNFEPITFSGMDEEEIKELNIDLKEYLRKKWYKGSNTYPLFKETIRLKTRKQDRLLTPIIVQKKIIGYCTLLQLRTESTISENDFMFIERAANASSLYLLNEKTSFEAMEKVKGFFLEQLLMGQYQSKEEVLNRSRVIGINLEHPFYLVAIECKESTPHQKQTTGNHFEEFLEVIVKYMDFQGYKALIGQYDGYIIMLISKEMEKRAGQIFKHIEMSFPKMHYRMGISDVIEDIEDIPEHLEEAFIALRMDAGKRMTHFHQLGIIGVLINSKNISGIKKLAKQEIGALYRLPESKKKELLKTLYVFLTNGGKLQQTMADLAISMSGLTYRINRIEELLDKDLRDPAQSYQLLLILDSLKALGELELNVLA